MEQAYKLEFATDQTGELYLNCCGCSKTEPLHSFGPAVKPHYLIHFILGGKGIFKFGGKEYPLEAGTGFLIEPGELAFYQADEKEPWTYLWVGFSGANAPALLHNMGLSTKHPIFASGQSDEMYRVVKDMMQHNTFGAANELRRNGLLSIFLSMIAEEVSIQEKEDDDKANTYVKRAIEFVCSNYCNPIKVTDIADYVCINRSYLYTLFQNQIKMSPQQFLTMFRIAKAGELLQLTNLPIESIAISCGYSDPLVFTKAFRQTKGMSPSKYRKEFKEGTSRHRLNDLEQIELFINQKKQ
ncbi:MAG: AraC family transcriptional regulator [Lachnospiraceae bacterium]|nr:AraC family transcriptional regulator [Lachnospiraceae bacterium]MBR3683627.1 AraC family transcriptional regulator [Lachnospiraceae bacterium]